MNVLNKIYDSKRKFRGGVKKVKDELADDIDDLIEQYGAEFLREDEEEEAPLPMSEIETYLEGMSPVDAFQAGESAYNFCGYKDSGYPNKTESFDWSADYFAIGIYGYFSINDYDLLDYLKPFFSGQRLDAFKSWCVEQGYSYEEDEDIEDSAKRKTLRKTRVRDTKRTIRPKRR